MVSIQDVMVSGRIVGNHIEILAYSIRQDPSACERKYLIAASVSCPVFELRIIGINLNILISSATQSKIQLVLDTTINVLSISVAPRSRINGVNIGYIRARRN